MEKLGCTPAARPGSEASNRLQTGKDTWEQCQHRASCTTGVETDMNHWPRFVRWARHVRRLRLIKCRDANADGSLPRAHFY